MCLGPCSADVGARIDPAAWLMPSVMRLFGALGGIDDAELRATFNGGIGMVIVVAPEAVGTALAALPEALVIGAVQSLADLGSRYVEDAGRFSA